MTHPMTRLAVAASILATLTLSVFFWGQTSSMALADVLRSIDQAGSFSLEARKTRTGRHNDTKVTKTIASEVFGMKMTEWNVDPNTQQQRLSAEMLLSLLQGKAIMLSHEKQIAVSVNLYEDSNESKNMVDGIRAMDPRTMLTKILACEYQRIGFSEIEGKTVEGFQTTDPNYFKWPKQPGIIATAWIDTESKLPVRIEETINWVNGNRWLTVSDQFQWAIPLNASDFEVTIPEHYISLGFDMPASSPIYDPNSAVSGLRYYREKHRRYPENLERLGSMMAVVPEDPEVLEGFEGLTDEQMREYLRKNKDEFKMTMGPMNGTVKLYRLLKEEERDWAYYGDRVTPEMPDAVLWRWSTPAGTYSVVLGDLSLIEVTKEELKASEAKLPD
ncbi:MAG: hypothetical protein AMJ65_05390 [Phycisphaerae bacterium SG8_4]|nr:MAG: hypothetical protein AMJ65_05390 [Phycisphaerae bacterium SG8_4]